MKVKIGNKIYSADDLPIMIIMEEDDKLFRLGTDESPYIIKQAFYPAGWWAAQNVEEWMGDIRDPNDDGEDDISILNTKFVPEGSPLPNETCLNEVELGVWRAIGFVQCEDRPHLWTHQFTPGLEYDLSASSLQGAINEVRKAIEKDVVKSMQKKWQELIGIEQ